jgi:hypothetical protein
MKFALPGDLDELENRRLGTANAAAALDPRLRALRNLLSNNSTQGEELRNAARLLFDSFAALEPGMAIALAFMSMEAVLLDSKTKESIVARLSEAVAYRLGRSAEQRKNLRKQVSKLYDARSSFVHTGKVDKSSTAVGEAREIACSVLRRETLDLDAVEEQKTELTPVSN